MTSFECYKLSVKGKNCSAFNPSKRTHTTVSSEQTHTHPWTQTVNTHPQQWAAIYAVAPEEQLGVLCLAQGHLSRGIEGGESAGQSLPHLQSLVDRRLKPVTFGLQIRLSIH